VELFVKISIGKLIEIHEILLKLSYLSLGLLSYSTCILVVGLDVTWNKFPSYKLCSVIT